MKQITILAIVVTVLGLGTFLMFRPSAKSPSVKHSPSSLQSDSPIRTKNMNGEARKTSQATSGVETSVQATGIKEPILPPSNNNLASAVDQETQLPHNQPISRSRPASPDSGAVAHQQNTQPLATAMPFPAPSLTGSTAGNGFAPATEIIEEIYLPANESIPAVLTDAVNPKTPELANALDAIAENYLENLESELSTPSAGGTDTRNPYRPSASSRLANQELRAIVGNQEADRMAREAHLLNQK